MVSEWLDGQLDAAEYGVLEGHVAGCHRCQADLEAFQSLDRLFASAPLMPAPADLRVRTMARLNRRGEVRRAVVGGLALALSATALGLLLLAPLLINCFGFQDLWPVISRGGPQTLQRILTLLSALGRATVAMIRNLAAPLVWMTAYGLVLALLLNTLWLRILRKVQTAA
jgi:hypothetical protein